MQKKVLVIEDSSTDAAIIQDLLESSNIIIQVAQNGEAGILAAEKMRPDLIILDVMMPNEGGIIMYQSIRMDNNLKNIPVIMLSAVAKKTFYHYLNMLNIKLNKDIPKPNAYIEKPPEAEELLAKISYLIGLNKH